MGLSAVRQTGTMPNRLAGETSPYLLQHAHNPVDWFPWGADALARAKLLDRPIFLSIGYAACHWCHVMERESFEDATTAAYMNDHFVAIKVDREERPDLDQLYMGAVQAMTGQRRLADVGLPDPRRPALLRRHVLPGRAAPRDAVLPPGARRRRRGPGASSATSSNRRARGWSSTLVEQQRTEVAGGRGRPDAGAARRGRGRDLRQLRPGQRRLGPRPEVPAADDRRVPAPPDGRRRPRARGGRAASTLEKMADGGIHDQLGGGFHRYATDAIWLVPHFEQMLYDNAQLARVYLHAWAQTGDARFREVADGRAGLPGPRAHDGRRRVRGQPGRGHGRRRGPDVHLDRGRDPRGARRRRRRRSSPRTASPTTGNWEGDDDPVARLAGVAHAAAVAARTPPSKRVSRRRGLGSSSAGRPGRSRPATTRRSRPGTGWRSRPSPTRGGSSRASRRYTAAAARAAEAITGGLLAADGALGRSWKDGRATGQGVLEDYADLADGLLALYEATFDERWFTTARALMDRVLARFADPAGGFFDTADDHERLVARPKDVQDNAVPSGNAMATPRAAAPGGVDRRGPIPRRGRARDADGDGVRGALPDRVRAVAVGDGPRARAGRRGGDRRRPGGSGDAGAHRRDDPRLPPEPGRGGQRGSRARPWSRCSADRIAIDGKPTAYVCRGFVCRLPVTTPEALRAELAPRPHASDRRPTADPPA